MSKRLNSNHIKPCACFECDKYPNRPRYTQDEWLKTYPSNLINCKFCGKRASRHGSNWASNGFDVRASCIIDDLKSKGIYYSIPFENAEDSASSYSSEHFYIPSKG